MKWTLILMILFVAECVAFGEQPKAPAGHLGSILPSFKAIDLEGHKTSSKDLKNKVVLIDFWATWCAPCRKEMPGYQSLFDRYHDRGFAVIGFKADMMEDTEDPIRFIREIGVHYPIAVATEEIRSKFGGVEGLPTTLIYDRHGILQNKIIGFEYTNRIEEIIKPLLDDESHGNE